LSRYRWRELPAVSPPAPAAGGLSPLVRQLLHNRGITGKEAQESFLTADRRLSHDPFLLPDIQPALARIYRALLSGESIAVYGDYDVDGITATAILVRGLESLGARVTPYIPHRLAEGYGLTTTALENLRGQGVSLVITVDCGITSLDEVRKARGKGLDIIITDHHTPAAAIPAAAAVISPRLPGAAYPCTELTGAGLAYKLLQAVLAGLGKEGAEDYLDLAAMGTIADMAPLLGENRYLVKEGLRRLNASPRLGIREILRQAGLSAGSLSAENFSWVIAPRLNAAGRLAHALTSYRLLLTDSPQEAAELAGWLGERNAERQRLTAADLARAREQVTAAGLAPLLVASGPDYHPGIAGLVAGRLSEEFYRPALVITTGRKVSSGSGRSIPEFNIIAALTRCRELLARFGGHSQAAGLTLPTANLAALTRELTGLAAEQLRGVDLRPRLDVDARVSLPELGGDTFGAIQRLEPFGRGNPLPVFLSRDVEVAECRPMGNGNEHIRFKLRQRGAIWDGVGFRLGCQAASVCRKLDIVYHLEIDCWGGTERLRLNLLDFAPAGQLIEG